MEDLAPPPLAGRFVLEHVAGTGGMGVVHRARDLAADRPVAVKLLQPTDAAGQARFQREAATLASLHHEAIVRYVAHGAAPDGRPYLVTEWIDGDSLSAHLAKRPLSVAATVALGRRLAHALAASHACGVIHRDVKPGNILLPGGSTDTAILIDFGIARAGRDALKATQTGMILGTPGYMAPEQARGDASVDGRTDLFSLGCVLYEALAGVPPFDGEHVMAILAKILLQPAAPLRPLRPSIPPALDALVMRLLAKSPDDRPASAAAVAAELDALHVRDADPGADSDRPRLAAPPESLAGEQRLVSVVVVTDRARSRQPGHSEAPDAPAHASERPTLEVDSDLSDLVGAFGGTLEILADGSHLLVFSAPGPATDQATLAARCALHVRATVAPAALVTLATGRGRRSTRWPVGEAIDRAVEIARSVAATTPHAVWIDDVTAGLLDARWEVAPGEGAHRIVREASDAEQIRPLLGKLTPFVGRARELRMLEGIVLSAFEESAATAVLVKGPAGVGKSRLRVELLRRLARAAAPRTDDPTAPPCDVWFARADTTRRSAPLGIVAQLVRAAAHILPEEGPALAHKHLWTAVDRTLPPEDAPRVAVFLGELAGLPFQLADKTSSPPLAPPARRAARTPARGASSPPPAPLLAHLRDLEEPLLAARRDPMLLADQMRRAFEDFVTARSAERPVLVVIEDLQWADAPSIRFLDAALRLVRHAPFCVVGFGRPDVDESLPRLWADRALVELSLPELTDKAAEDLALAVLGPTTPRATLQAIVARAAGNAFCLEELLRAAAAGDTDQVPATVLAMAQARLGALDAPLRRVLRAASVFGSVFWRGGVAALLGGEDRARELPRALRDLEAREVLERDASSRFPGEEQLTFRNALLRDAAYAMLTDEDRPGAHALAADWLAAHAEPSALVVANHLALAERPESAPRWLLRAAEQALEAGDLPATVSLCEHALSLVSVARTTSAESAAHLAGSIHLLLAEAQRWRGAFGAAEEAASAAAELLPRGTRPWLRALEETLVAAGRRGDGPTVHHLATTAAAARPPEDALGAQLACLCAAARHFLHSGDLPTADTWMERARILAASPSLHDPRALAEMFRLQGARARQIGDPVADRDAYARALAELTRTGDLRAAANARTSLGFSHIQLGAFAAAEAELTRALAEAERLGLDAVRVRAQQNLGLVLAARGDLPAALALEEQVAATCRAQGNTRFEAWTRVYLALIADRSDDPTRTLAEATTAAAALTASPSALAGALALQARSLTRTGHHQEARARAAEALSILDRLGGIEEFESLVRTTYLETFGPEDPRARNVATEGARRLEAHAAHLESPAERTAYLEAIPEHRILRAFATAITK